jgi:hypothetical protein
MRFANAGDIAEIETHMPWPDSLPARTLYSALTRTARKTWAAQRAELPDVFGSEGQGRNADMVRAARPRHAGGEPVPRARRRRDGCVAFVLPNCNETAVTILGGAVAGIVNPINPLLEPEQIAGILRETGAKVVVTLKEFPKTDVAQKMAEAVRNAPDVQVVLEVDLNRYLTGRRNSSCRSSARRTDGHRARVVDWEAEVAKHPRDADLRGQHEDRVAAYFTPAAPRACRRSRSTPTRG